VNVGRRRDEESAAARAKIASASAVARRSARLDDGGDVR